jgi:signal transduction histidine kinase
VGVAVIYALLWLENEEFDTATPGSPLLITISSAPFLVALALVGARAVPLLLLAEALARWMQRRWRQPLGYLFNFNQSAITSLVTLAALKTVVGEDLSLLAALPTGPVRFVLILAAYELTDRLSFALLEAVGSRVPVQEVIRRSVRPLELVSLIPSAMGLLIATAVVVAAGLVVPLLIPIVLSRFAIKAIARWAHRHELLREQVAAQTKTLRAQAEQIAALEQARHQHTVLLVHDLEHEFRLGQRLVRSTMHHGAPDPIHTGGAESDLMVVRELDAVFERGLAMSADMLLGSKLRAGQVQLQPALTNLTNLVAKVVGRHHTLAAAGDVQLSFHCDSIVSVVVDAPKLERVLANLLSNAIAYTKGCPRRLVSVTLSQGDGAVHFTVADTGIGIEPEKIEQIGQRFRRLAEGQEFHHGSGLGLFGVDVLVRMHGGTLTIHSAGRNQGTMVTVKLPDSGLSCEPGKTASSTPETQTV